ncbi:MAG: chemotaxis protein CheW [Peptococcaceae bacterium BICA1-7]|nr:MAG: chemotaxis protein CheW [Peptococcaceae bacterium BICA1-7]HBV99210.1 chemotaxis protein CheW [Desulfotomaculum sp.]
MSVNQAVVFELSGVRYGIDVIRVQEIIRMVDITPVSEADANVEGIINLRGQVLPVINLSRRLGLTEKEWDRESRIIVVESGDKKIGYIVDRVFEVGTYSLEEVEDPSGVGGQINFLSGIIKKKDHMWLLLNLSEVA